MHNIPVSFINHANAIETIWCLDSTNADIILAETIKNYDSGYINIDQIFEALGYFAIYHLKELETIYSFCTQLISKYQITKIMPSIKSHSLRYILKENGYTDINTEKSIMNEHIFAMRQNNLHFAKDWSMQEIIYVYPFQSIEFAILNDDIDLFKEFFKYPTPPPAKITMIDSPYYPELSIIDACAYYGAQNCFFFLLENHIKLTDNSFKCSIIGGNTKIILACESNKIDNSFLDIAINAHHFAVAKWLETKYKLIFSWVSCSTS
ncbi:hypothetical protein TVAG_040470 [Trichomonas vaginalis G3]|uniref:DUF3447 domain-containing protein n=1 Tax=Trichomonas vaginalis (strain ATCC PRA-98 / G3) TaxID=412133 RepID=A2F1U2_TRIV3|nr:spectrin binding [Trichomonas vaginalis G3]EAY01142.1 hypothetical protein TVAG_040470 [Trichomonas vaginalis G3]KAI5540519.1 spectrin binding [Trichomonas vaginalis G3]|eukprot:XP_001313994.1 hypothetical protein [Trichomonas vaginalis G3]